VLCLLMISYEHEIIQCYSALPTFYNTYLKNVKRPNLEKILISEAQNIAYYGTIKRQV
jgi:hypothetical protein